MGGVVLAIDQGTSATKVVVATTHGDVLGLAEAAVAVSATTDGAVEFDPEAMWQSVLDASHAALTAAGNPAIDAIGLGNQGETIIPTITGTAHVMAETTLLFESGDPFCSGIH